MALTSNEIRITSGTGGQKGAKDERVGLIPPEALLALSRVYAFGGKKYEDHNYRKGYKWSLSIDALSRHFLSWQAGEELDPESGESHLMHAAWHCFALFMFTQDHPEFDDRFSTVREQFIPKEREPNFLDNLFNVKLAAEAS